ncbi:HEPN family nuclease [Clostridium algidicarnis]|nr:HEPN family nuclease [Clostridium algidicarnis]MBU3204975.1 hypothetical protein [Clostridium algidicarnis]MBU3213129.1 hypothetical protein [Clostridium algidicarnis]
MDIDKILKRNPNITLREYVDGQKQKTNVWKENSGFPIYNLGSLLMMAYAFLVIPKESIEKYGLKVYSPTIESLLSKITIIENKKQNGLIEGENIIRHIRNSISHANFHMISETEKLLFIDEHYGKITFQGEMKINDFKSLISEYYKTYYESYHETFMPNSIKHVLTRNPGWNRMENLVARSPLRPSELSDKSISLK